MPTIGTMKLLGGRPCLDLVNTVDARQDRWGPDLLGCYEDLLVWSGRTGVLTPGEIEAAQATAALAPDEAKAALDRAVALREAVAVLATPERGPNLPAQEACLAQEVAEARRCLHIRRVADGFAWLWDGEAALERVLHRVAIDAATLLTDTSLRHRVKICPGPNCGWLFLDETRNSSRRYCRDEGCGAQARMKRFRARKS